MERVIIHSDMNSCYASIECALNPELRGKAVAVGGSVEDRHGIILAKTQQAKKFDVKTGEAIWQAKQKCPDLIVVPPHFDQYIKYFRLAHNIYGRYTDRIEPMGLDEAWCDITGSLKLFGGTEQITRQIRESFKNELGITVSIGVSFNKIFAKLGSDLADVDSVREISKDSFKKDIWNLPSSAMMGVGRKTAKKLSGYGIETIGDIARCSPEWLKLVLGVTGVDLWNFANGYDNSPVAQAGYSAPVKSIGHGITCTMDLVDANEVWKVFLYLSQDVSRRLRQEQLVASGVQISVRDSQFSTRLFQCELPFSSQSATEIAQTAISLFNKNYRWNYDVRAVSVKAINLRRVGEPCQLSFYQDFKKHEKQQRIDDAVMDIRRRFGENVIFNACLMEEKKVPSNKNTVNTLPKKMHR